MENNIISLQNFAKCVNNNDDGIYMPLTGEPQKINIHLNNIYYNKINKSGMMYMIILNYI